MLRRYGFLGVLVLPLSSVFDLAPTAPSERVGVRPPIYLTFLDQPLVDKRVEVRIQPAVMDLCLVVGLELLLDLEAVGFVQAGDRVQEISLESGKVVH